MTDRGILLYTIDMSTETQTNIDLYEGRSPYYARLMSHFGEVMNRDQVEEVLKDHGHSYHDYAQDFDKAIMPAETHPADLLAWLGY